MKISIQESDNNLADDPDFIYTDKMDLPVLITCEGKKEIVMKSQYSDCIVIREDKLIDSGARRYRSAICTPITIDEINVKYSRRKNGS